MKTLKLNENSQEEKKKNELMKNTLKYAHTISIKSK